MAATDELVSLAAPEVRTFAAFEIRDVQGTESGSFIEGRAVPYDTWDDVGWFMEQFKKGSFSKSIKEAARGLPLLLWHDNRKMPVGVSSEWREMDEGLQGIWRIDTKDDQAMEAARKARDGFLTGLSVGFAPIEQDTQMDDNGMMWVSRTQARLLEVSLTPTPAYAGAQVSLVRSRVPHGGRNPSTRRSAQLESWKDYLKGIQK